MPSINPGPAINGFGSLFSTISNSQKALIFSAALTPSSVAANTTAEQIFSLTSGTGIVVTDFISVNKLTAQAGLGIVNARAVGVDQIAITYANTTGISITPAAEAYLCKAEKVTAVQSTFPY